VAKASSAEQLRLLDLQALDATLNHLRNRTRDISNNADIAALGEKLAAANSELAAATTAVEGAERDLERAEGDVQTVTARIERDQKRLDSGSGTSKDLMALQSELASLNKRRSDLEDTELEVMERLDELKARLASQQTATDAVMDELSALEEKRDAELAAIDEERNAVLHQRAELAATFEPALLAVYEKTLARRGVGAARLFHGRSEGSGMQLSPGDLADIRKAAEDDIVFCPDSGCILVRSAEWGN
jgi:uncharacterized protein